MPIQVAEQVVDVLGRNRVSIPFLDVERQQSLILVRLGLGDKCRKVVGEVFDELLINILAQ